MGDTETLAVEGISEAMSARDVLLWGIEKFHPRIAFASSFGAEDMVVIDMLAEIGHPDVRIFTLDTGRLHEETYAVMQAVIDRYGLSIETFVPDSQRIQALEREKGFYSFRQSLENRKECCAIRKVEPLGRALQGLDAWITGLRREQAVTRAGLPKVGADPDRAALIKLNPLADWTHDQVWDYLRVRGVPVNALHARGFPSIGCSPCTRAIQPGEDVRAGRWWWELPEHRECGLHARGAGAAGRAAK
jgi:phosphoadenosine phosphosulfate reductase